MQKLISVDTWLKTNFSDVNHLISRWLSECVVDHKISARPIIWADNEKFPSYRVGQAVEFLVRFKMFGLNDDLFRSIKHGFENLELFIENYHDWYKTRETCRYSRVELKVILSASRGYLLRLEQLLKSGVISDEAIDLTLRLTNLITLGSHCCYKYFWDHCHINFTSDLINNVRTMVERTLEVKALVDLCGSNFKLDGEAAFCTKIFGGVVDFHGEDYFLDLKCHWTLTFWQKAVMQMIVYLLLAKYTCGDRIKFGLIYNPRYDVIYKIDVSKIPSELIDAIESRW